MTDRDFLEMFHKIDDKFLEEAQRDQRRHRISRQRIFNTLSTMAACMAIIISAVLLVSSFISSGQFVLSSPSSAVQTSSGDPMGAASATSSEDSSQVAPSPQKLSVGSSTLSFPQHRVDLDLPKEDCYNAFAAAEPETVSAVFAFSVQLSDGSLDTRIPARMYVFADGQPISFRYRSSESFFRDFTIVPDTDYSLPLYFKASQDMNAISVVCVFFPGDPERQFCLIQTAGNIFGIKEVRDTFIDVGDYIEIFGEVSSDFVTVTSASDTIPKNGIVYWDHDIPADSAYLAASLGMMFGNDTSYEDFIMSNPHYIIALVNGKPVNIFDSEDPFVIDGFYNSNKGLLFQYKIPEEYLPENSTLQIIALPTAVTSWRDMDLRSDCFRIV